jgi:hypothetical protein
VKITAVDKHVAARPAYAASMLDMSGVYDARRYGAQLSHCPADGYRPEPRLH